MSASSGKIALVSSTAALGCGATCHADPAVVDFIGYGGSASDFEGSGGAPAGSNVASDSRDARFADTDDNAADFASGAPAPDNCASTGTCSVAQDSTIAQIQGAAQISPLKGVAVSGVTGVVTAANAKGFWMQDPRGSSAPGYVDGASSAIYVFTSSPPTDYPVGSAVTVAGTVSEFRPGAQGLTITELTGPTVSVTASGQPLPDPTLVGPGGLEPPPTVIDHEGTPADPIDVETEGTFDPAVDGIDFWESLEGMRIEIDDARAVGPTDTDFGETPIVPAGAGTETTRGGIVLLPTDPNPERIILDDSLGTFVPVADTGDTYSGPTVGIVDYDFNDFHLLATQSPTLVSGGIQREVARARRAGRAVCRHLQRREPRPDGPPVEVRRPGADHRRQPASARPAGPRGGPGQQRTYRQRRRRRQRDPAGPGRRDQRRRRPDLRLAADQPRQRRGGWRARRQHPGGVPHPGGHATQLRRA